MAGMKTVDAGWGGMDGFKQKQVELTITDECEWGGRGGVENHFQFLAQAVGPIECHSLR